MGTISVFKSCALLRRKAKKTKKNNKKKTENSRVASPECASIQIKDIITDTVMLLYSMLQKLFELKKIVQFG